MLTFKRVSLVQYGIITLLNKQVKTLRIKELDHLIEVWMI